MDVERTLAIVNRLPVTGNIAQLAFVPLDFQASIEFWTGTLGVGPFFEVEHIQVNELIYEGVSSQVDYSLAVTQWGDLEIELIRQHDQSPSVFRDWCSNSLHHVQLVVDDYDQAAACCRKAGLPLAMEILGVPEVPDFRVGFFEMGVGAPFGYLELAYFPNKDGWRAANERIKSHVLSWDGYHPLRKICEL